MILTLFSNLRHYCVKKYGQILKWKNKLTAALKQLFSHGVDEKFHLCCPVLEIRLAVKHPGQIYYTTGNHHILKMSSFIYDSCL